MAKKLKMSVKIQDSDKYPKCNLGLSITLCLHLGFPFNSSFSDFLPKTF